MNYLEIYKIAENYVTDLFDKHASEHLYYHNLKHTRFVVGRCKEIAGNYQIDEEEMLVLILAAWFHDTGYIFTVPQIHEEKSVDILTAFMKSHEMHEDLIHYASACIMATKPPRSPHNLLEQIICDADTYHFGTEKFKKSNNQIFKEWKVMEPLLERHVFDEKAIQLLEQHVFYTGYCDSLLTEQKLQTLKKLKEKRDKKNDKEQGGDRPVKISTEKSEKNTWLRTWFRKPDDPNMHTIQAFPKQESFFSRFAKELEYHNLNFGYVV